MKILLKSRHRLFSFFCLLSCTTFLLSCADDWEDVKKYTDGGEIVYPGKFDSVAVFPGNQRVRLWGRLTADPKVRKVKIFWDNNQHSAEFDVKPAESDFLFDKIVDVGEGTKSFTMHTYDEAGHASVGVTITGNSYGTRYRNTLSNRRIKSIAYSAVSTTIEWDLIDTKLGPVQMEVSYQTPSGDTLVITPAGSTTTTLKRLDFRKEGFTWRTVFRPTPITIDTFATASTYTAPPDAIVEPIPVENNSFELPANGKVNNWTLIPGWETDKPPVDSGVEGGGSTGGYRAYLGVGDPAIWNLTGHTIAAKDEFTLNLDFFNIWQASNLQIRLYYDLGDGVRHELATKVYTNTGGWQTFEVTGTATAAAVGGKLGVELLNTANGWLGIDNIQLKVKH